MLIEFLQGLLGDANPKTEAEKNNSDTTANKMVDMQIEDFNCMSLDYDAPKGDLGTYMNKVL